jgi:hypothetical protein
MLNDHRVRALLALLAALAAAGVTITLVDNGPDRPTGTPRRTITVALGGPGHKKVALPPAAQAQVKQQAEEDAAGEDDEAESDLHEKTPPTAGQLEQARKVAPAGSPAIPASPTFAAPSTPGCRSAFVRNTSLRAPGSRVVLGVIHWTGSRPLPGWADINGNAKWFDTPASQASSTYITDDEGHCLYAVPESKKPWTQVRFNSVSVSDEHVNQGVLPVFPTAAGQRAVVRLMVGWHHRWKIPYRRGVVTQSDCKVLRSGFVAHRDLGPCGGGHPDIGVPSALDQLIAEAARTDPGAPKATTSTDRATCRKLNWWRAHGRPHGSPERNAIRRRAALTRRGVTCTSSGPVRRT